MAKHQLARRQFIKTSSLGLMAGAFGIELKRHRRRSALDRIRVGVIGTGSRGRGLMELIIPQPEVEIVATCDIIPANLEAGLQLLDAQARGYIDYRDLLARPDIDAVIIATPLFQHFTMAKAAVEARKHVYLEKSLTYDIPQAIELARLVSASPLVFQVGYQYRYYALYHTAKRILKEGALGQITAIDCQYNRNSNWRNPCPDPALEKVINWRLYREFCGGPLSELCAHQIDMVHYMLDAHPLTAVGQGGVNYWKDGRTTFDNIKAVYQYSNDMVVTYSSILSNAFNGFMLRLQGENATLEIQRDSMHLYAERKENLKGLVDGVTGATLLNLTQGKPIEIPYWENNKADIPEPTVTAISEFFRCIREKDQPLSNVENAKATSIAVHMGNTAAETGMLQKWPV